MRPRGSWGPWELRDHVLLDDTEGGPGVWGEGLLRPAPQLGTEHVQRCVVLPDRIALLEQLPKGGVVAEVGTLHGEFAREILRRVEPRELHVIDHEIDTRVNEMADE